MDSEVQSAAVKKAELAELAGLAELDLLRSVARSHLRTAGKAWRLT